ncbi:MAG: hypothetical protein E7393_04830 [Ruminococcaceae bacterium]|nr:hypothetical protein [Oscillospiraceae bacterium]
MLCYENDWGSLQLYGGGGVWNVTECVGLELPNKVFQVVQYAEMPGQVTMQERAEARVVTLRGDCCGGRQALSEGMRILNQKGRLWIQGQGIFRQIEAYCSLFEIQKHHGEYVEFIMQFTCDDPYFGAEEPVRMAMYGRRDLVEGSFKMPCLFTSRLTTATIYNNGDVKAEPIFTIYCKSVGSGGDTQGICIENTTTGAKFMLDYTMVEGETITVDIPNRQIYSDLKTTDNNEGNLIEYISKDTYLSDLALVVGENQFTTSNYNVGSDIIIVCELKEKYLEAVM